MSKSGVVVTSLALGLGVLLYTLFHSRTTRQSHSQNDLDLEQFHQQRAEQTALGLKETRKILAVTRVHKGSSASHMSSKENVLDFVRNSMAYASSVLICVRGTLLTLCELTYDCSPSYIILYTSLYSLTAWQLQYN